MKKELRRYLKKGFACDKFHLSIFHRQSIFIFIIIIINILYGTIKTFTRFQYNYIKTNN